MLISISVTKENEEKLRELYGDIPKGSKCLELLLNYGAIRGQQTLKGGGSIDISPIIDMLVKIDGRLDKMGDWIKDNSFQKSSASSSTTQVASSRGGLVESPTVKGVLDEMGIDYTDKELSMYMVYVNPKFKTLNAMYYKVEKEYEICKKEYENVGYVYEPRRGEMSWEECLRVKGWEDFDYMYDKLQEFK